VSTAFYLSYAALWILVGFQGLVMVGLTRTIYRRNAEAAADPNVLGRTAPDFVGVDTRGTTFDSRERHDRLRALLFVSPSCDGCSVTLDELSALETKAHGELVVVCRGAEDACRRRAATYELEMPVLIDYDQEISDLYEITGVPTAVLIDESNRVKSHGQPKRDNELVEIFGGEPQDAPVV
jgi:peroxiredoxin